MSRGPVRSLAFAWAAIVVALAPAAAAAASATTTPKTSPATPAATTARPVAKGALKLYLHNAFAVSHELVTVPGRVIHVDGVVRPFVAGQHVTLKAFEGARRLTVQRLRIKLSRNGTYGRFSGNVSVPKAGDVSVRVTHRRTAQQLGFVTRRGIMVLEPSAGFGAGGRFVQLVQQRLAALHFYIPQTGVYDGGTGLAVDAYHRLLGHGVSESLDAATISDLLNGVGQFHIRYPKHGRHAEGDLSRQVLALIDKGKVVALYPISSGKPSTPTVLGSFHVYLKTPGYLPDGMYYSNFFTGGYAIHGFNPAPDYPASHGCMRVPIVDAISIYHWLNVGDGVDVYYEH
ncbi:MAG TPA: L,D-transpeptidase [Solirubrobacteraceae bacterium]|nr:L,D-transpeptidase [Solirubrobacteraceae bacterium]